MLPWFLLSMHKSVRAVVSLMGTHRQRVPDRRAYKRCARDTEEYAIDAGR